MDLVTHFCRVLARQHGSAEDLTFLGKARRQRDEKGNIPEPVQSKTVSSWTIGSESFAARRKASPKPGSRSEIESSSDGKYTLNC